MHISVWRAYPVHASYPARPTEPALCPPLSLPPSHSSSLCLARSVSILNKVCIIDLPRIKSPFKNAPKKRKNRRCGANWAHSLLPFLPLLSNPQLSELPNPLPQKKDQNCVEKLSAAGKWPTRTTTTTGRNCKIGHFSYGLWLGGSAWIGEGANWGGGKEEGRVSELVSLGLVWSWSLGPFGGRFCCL